MISRLVPQWFGCQDEQEEFVSYVDFVLYDLLS